MIGIVVVSHSRPLAEAAVVLASEMVPAGRRPVVAVAAGLDDRTLGTDAEAIAGAIEAADSEDGVLVLMDLGSALLSADLALELVDPDAASRVRLSPAPLVEGLVAALVTASSGAGLDRVAADAEDALRPKWEQLGAAEAAPAARADPATAVEVAGALAWEAELANPHGLHARPAAAFVAAVGSLDAEVTVTNLTTGAGPVDGQSMLYLATLDARRGHRIRALVTGPDAERAVEALAAWAASGFGED